MSAKTGRESGQFMLRLPPDLRERIKRKADGQSRSMSSVIVEVLEKEFPAPSFNEAISDIVTALEAADMVFGESASEGYVNQAIKGIAGSVLHSASEHISEETRERLSELIARS